MDISGLKNSVEYGDTFAQTARFLCRDVSEVREKMKELGLVAQHAASFSRTHSPTG